MLRKLEFVAAFSAAAVGSWLHRVTVAVCLSSCHGRPLFELKLCNRVNLNKTENHHVPVGPLSYPNSENADDVDVEYGGDSARGGR